MIITFILIFFVGKAFYDLADNHQKSKWLFAIVGIISYFAGQLIVGVIIAIVYELFVGSVDEINDTVLNIISIPVGALSCWGFYRILKNRWEKEETFSGSSEEVLDANIIDQDPEKL